MTHWKFDLVLHPALKIEKLTSKYLKLAISVINIKNN